MHNFHFLIVDTLNVISVNASSVVEATRFIMEHMGYVPSDVQFIGKEAI